jgi:hypothetical protein
LLLSLHIYECNRNLAFLVVRHQNVSLLECALHVQLND